MLEEVWVDVVLGVAIGVLAVVLAGAGLLLLTIGLVTVYVVVVVNIGVVGLEIAVNPPVQL